MKNLPWIGIPVLGFFVVSTLFPPTADVVEQAKQYFTPEEIAQGQQFAFQRRLLFWGNALAQLALMVYLAFTPLGKRLYLKTSTVVQGHWFAQLLLLGGIYFLASAAIALPFRIGQYALNVSWDMTTQSFVGWFVDHLKALTVTGILDAVAVGAFYAIVRALPKYWWVATGAGSMVFAIVVAFILPDVIAPLFNTFTPISQSKWKTAERRIVPLGKDIPVPASSVYVVDASRQSTAGNAYFTGLGPTQRIVLYDTLLENTDQEEADTIIAHEMGHWYQDHIWKGIAFGGAALTVALFGLFRYLNVLVEGGALRSAGDPAGLFRVILLAQLAFAVSLPIQNAVSRMFERQADEFALHVSKNPKAFVRAEKRLALQNKSNVAPSRLNVMLFATHPPVVERIQMAEKWEKEKSPAPK